LLSAAVVALAAIAAAPVAASAVERAPTCEDSEAALLQTQLRAPLAVAAAAVDPAVKMVTDLNPDLWFQMPQERRSQKCVNRRYDISKMPAVAVIIPYLHENVTLMQRLVGSLIANTPESLLQEILFVDDANEATTSYADILRRLHPKVKVHSNAERQGLTKAKVTGTEHTTAPVIVFMEPHCIANKQWVEPLLERLLQSRKRVVVPAIDDLDEDNTNRYVYLGNLWGGFGLNLEFKWGGDIGGRNRTWQQPEPYPMPALSGGILAMWRGWWEESGRYDAEMREWGGENIEMSLRIWRCGGDIEAVPCSRIGHMFRRARPYTFHGEVYRRNELRLASVWLPEYLPVVYKVQPDLPKFMHTVGDVSSRRALQDRLQCKSMDWYIDSVYPELRGEIDRVLRSQGTPRP